MNPDVVFLLGDIVDGEIGPVLRGDLLQYFTVPNAMTDFMQLPGIMNSLEEAAVQFHILKVKE